MHQRKKEKKLAPFSGIPFDNAGGFLALKDGVYGGFFPLFLKHA